MAGAPDRKFLNRYFRSIYNKLEADALLFNRRLPHEGLKGSENERALADVIRDFLPPRYGVEENALVIDRHGAVSRQSDIVIFEASRFPKYLRKVFPIETIHAVIEVKTEISKQQVDIALENEAALRKLDFYPALTPYWQTRTQNERIGNYPPVHSIFGYRSSSEDFGTFIGWFSPLPTWTQPVPNAPYHPSTNHFIGCALDKGVIFCRGDGHVPRWMPVAGERDDERNFTVVANGHRFEVDPAKCLFFFLETLWTMLEQSPRHPGFDIRSYMDFELSSGIEFGPDGRILG
jgi:hypothetical protein